MKSKLVFACAMVVVLLSVIACSPTPKQVSLEISCDDLTNTQHISREVEVPAGGSLTITLCSNPTTGFQWSESAQISDQAVLEQVDHKFVPPEQQIPGAGGKEVWTFKALKSGTSQVSMDYSRPWEGGEKGQWTFNATVAVK